jgi:hypothetical protein
MNRFIMNKINVYDLYQNFSSKYILNITELSTIFNDNYVNTTKDIFIEDILKKHFKYLIYSDKDADINDKLKHNIRLFQKNPDNHYEQYIKSRIIINEPLNNINTDTWCYDNYKPDLEINIGIDLDFNVILGQQKQKLTQILKIISNDNINDNINDNDNQVNTNNIINLEIHLLIKSIHKYVHYNEMQNGININCEKLKSLLNVDKLTYYNLSELISKYIYTT